MINFLNYAIVKHGKLGTFRTDSNNSKSSNTNMVEFEIIRGNHISRLMEFLYSISCAKRRN